MTEADEIRYLALLKEEMICRARRDLLSFTLMTKRDSDGKPDYRVNWHHRAVARKLTAFARGEIQYLMVFMPPRHGKSELVSRRLPAYLHGLYPDAEIMAASYLDSLAGDMTIDVQNIIASPLYKKIFPLTKIWPPGTSYTKGTRNSSEHHIVGRRGKYRGQGVGGSFTGKGANFIIIDDPIKGREIADSEVFRERLWKFWTDDLFSRLETNLTDGRPGQVLITQTRWHEDDLSGRLLEQMKQKPDAIQWEVVNYPAIRVDMDTMSDARAIGDALWPEKYSIEQLLQIKESSRDGRGWSSLYQQDPRPDGGAKFKENMFRTGPMPESFDWTFIMVDTAYKDKQENDYTVASYFGVKDKELQWIDIWREHIDAADMELPVSNFIKKNSKYGFRGAYIEPKGHGIYLNKRLPKAPYGCRIPPDDVVEEFFKDRKLDKVERANNAIPQLVGRYVTINEKIPQTMREIMMGEILSFPRAKHDDIVDTLIDGVKLLFGRPLSICDVA